MHKKNMPPEYAASSRPVAAVLTGAFMISFSAVWVVLADVEPTTSAFYRVFFGTIFLGIAALFGQEFRHFRHIRITPFIFCGFAFALDLYFWHTSVLYIGPGLATILGNFQVFLMAICGALFFQEKLTLRFVISLPLAICGLLLVVGIDWGGLSPNYRIGLFFGLLTALCYTAFMLSLRRIQTVKNAALRFTPLMFVSLFSACFLGLELLATGASFAIPSVSSWGALLSLGLLSQATGWILIATAMPKIRASFTGLVLLLQPSLSFLWDVLFFSRPTSPIQWLGVSITLAAIYLGLTGSRPGK